MVGRCEQVECVRVLCAEMRVEVLCRVVVRLPIVSEKRRCVPEPAALIVLPVAVTAGSAEPPNDPSANHPGSEPPPGLHEPRTAASLPLS